MSHHSSRSRSRHSSRSRRRSNSEDLLEFLKREETPKCWIEYIMQETNKETQRYLRKKLHYSRSRKCTVIKHWNSIFAELKWQIVSRFLVDNKVNWRWFAFFMNNESVWNALANSLCQLSLEFSSKDWHPSKENVLAAFQFCQKPKLKVILFGEDPKEGYATGLAFSYVEGTKEGDSNIHGSSAVVKLHNVLRQVHEEHEIKTPKKEYTSCCHEDWAEKGVLLLNSALTFTHKKDKPKHQKIWRGFMRALMFALLSDPKHVKRDIYVLFWGSVSETIYEDLKSMGLTRHYSHHRFYIGPHPAERRGIFRSEAFKHLTAIFQRWPNLLRLKEVGEESSSEESSSDESSEEESSSEESSSDEGSEEESSLRGE